MEESLSGTLGLDIPPIRRGDRMRRRAFISLLGGAATWPLAARAQQAAIPVVGLLRNAPSASFDHLVAALRLGLSEAGFVDGRNVAIQQRWAEGRDDRLPALLADLISLKAAVIVANTIGALAAKAEGTNIPVVFTTGSDPVRDGLVASLNRPGGNFTGVIFNSGELGTKRLELLRQLAPKAATIAMLVGPSNPETVAEQTDVHKAVQAFGQQFVLANANSVGEIEAAFAKFVERGAGALFVGTGAFTNSPGYGSAPHVFGELFKMMTGIDLVHIPYRDSYWADLVAGQTQILFAPVISATGYVQSGQLRALAVTTRTRLETMPAIPALDEFVPGYEASGWLGVGAPKNTPFEIIDKLNNEINAALADAKAKSRLADVGVVLMPMAPDELGKFIAADTEKWAKVVKFAGIKLQ